MPRINSNESLEVKGTFDISSARTVIYKDGNIPASALVEDSLAPFVIRPDSLRTWDDFSANLPGTAATDDLAIIEGTFGTDAPTVQSSDAKATTVTQYARFQLPVPNTYKTGQDIVVQIRAGMITTISDGTATVDVECYKHDGDGSVGSDICATAAQSINSLTKADFDFTITATSVIPGDVLDIRLTVAITDTATATAVIGEISKVTMQFDAR